jgi:hypothetical protein
LKSGNRRGRKEGAGPAEEEVLEWRIDYEIIARG